MSLFTIALERALTYPMVEQFLRLGDPDSERPQENTLLDFSENVPSDLGDVVTAFSNTDGGLVFLGVKEKKRQQLAIPDAICGIQQSSVEVRGKIINIICSTVQPRPVFTVGVVPTVEDPGRVVVIVRVEEGTDTPYMYIRDQENKVSVRIGDSNKKASREAVKALCGKAIQEGLEKEETRGAIGNPYVMRGGSRCGAYQQLFWIPSRPLKIRLDQLAERSFEESIRSCFQQDRDSEIEVTQTAAFTDFDGYNKEQDHHRKWRLSDRGAISFVSKVGRIPPQLFQEQPGREIDDVGDWILDVLSFIKLAKRLAEHLGFLGNGDLEHSMSCYVGGPGLRISKTIPTRNSGRDVEMKSVWIPDPIVVVPMPSVKQWTINLSQLENQDIVEMVADSFLLHIRHLGGQVVWGRLVEEIRQLKDFLESQG